ncbi:MAG: tetratricopeptide repeat protein [Leptolyngbya sp. PLA1]|nr:tetratricopeptide repeat protein [Leptolyngbya sp. PLA1]
MPPSRTVPLRRPRPFHALLPLCGVALALQACAGPARPANRTDAPSLAPGARVARLAELADAESGRTLRTPVPLSPGLNPADVAPIDPSDTAARAPLASLLPAPDPTELSSQPAPDESLRLYARGRAELIDGQPDAALADLEAAARLDPGSPTILREIAEAQLALGRRASAIATLRRAQSLGLREPRANAILGRESLRARRTHDALAELGSAFQSPAISPIQRTIVGVDLSDALYESGHLAASREVLEGSLTRLSLAGAPARHRAELAEVVRRRADLWRRAGDVSCRLGEFDRALQCYQRARDAAGAEPGTLVAREVFALRSLGRPASAALLVLDDIRAQGGRVQDRHVPVLRAICEGSDLAGVVAPALAELASELPDGALPSVQSGLSRAAAAVLPTDDAAARLAAHLARWPSDAAAADDLAAALRTLQVRARADALSRCVSASPDAAPTLASALVSLGDQTFELTDELAESRSPAARLLAAFICCRTGEAPRALRLLGDTPPEGAPRPAWLIARAAAAFDSGDTATLSATRDLADRAALDGSNPDRIAAALIAAISSDLPRARALLDPLLAGEPGPEVLLTAAEFALSSGDAATAETLLTRSLAADRFDERPYEGLLTLYSSEGPRADAARLASTARALRQSIPASRLIRRVAAQDLVSRSLWPQAESTLLGLMGPTSEDPRSLHLLTTVWERAAAASPELTARGESWLRERLASRPQSPALVASLARVLVAREHAAEADALLADFTLRAPTPDLLRLREWVLREGLEKPDEALALALARFERGPRTPAAAIEQAELLASREKFDLAANVLSERLPPDVTLTPDQTERLARILSGLKPGELAKGPPEAAQGAVRLFDLVARGNTSLPPALLVARILLIAAAYPDQSARILDAVEDFARQYPDARERTLVQTAESLLARDDASPGLRYLRAAADRAPELSGLLLSEWFRLTVLRGDADDVTWFIAQCDPPTILGILQDRRTSPIDLAATPDAQRAEVAYQLGSELNSLERRDQAVTAYREAIRLSPRHAWANNNLGYLLLEEGHDLAESEAMIHIAFEQLGDDFHVIDSLAWVRYKRGKLLDVPPTATSPAEEGAVTLLTRALALSKAQALEDGEVIDPTIAEHLGDALWRTGAKDDAQAAWRTALDSVSRLLEVFDSRFTDPEQSPDFVKKLRLDLQRLRARLDAASAGREPDIAPLANP